MKYGYLLSAIVCLCILVGDSLGQAKVPKIEPFGIDGFRLMLQQQGLETTQTQIGTALRTPEETVLVVLGDLSSALRIQQQLTAFVDSGGAMLVATDLGGARTRSSNWLYQSQFRYQRTSFRGQDCVDGHSDCPNVTTLEHSVAPDLFDGVNTVVANRPGSLVAGRTMETIAWLPATGRSRSSKPLMAFKQDVGNSTGRILLIADHSIFINEMLIHGDNARFASNVASWLTEGGNRRRLVVIHDGRVLPEWSFSATPPAVPLKSLLQAVKQHGLAGLPVADALIPMMNQSLVQFERQGGFNEMTHTFGRALFGRRPYRQVLLLFTGCLLLIAARWIFVSRSRAQKWLFFQDRELRAETRLTAAIQERQYQPYLKALSREFFIDSGVTRFSERENYPIVELSRMLGKSKVAKEVAAFWEIATATEPARISMKKYRQQIDRLRELHHLQSKGILKLE